MICSIFFRRNPWSGAFAILGTMLLFPSPALGSQWVEHYGLTSHSGGTYNSALSGDLTDDGGFITAGFTDHFGAGNNDFLIVKTDGNGRIDWQRAYGGTDGELAEAVARTADGGFIVAGYGSSFGSDGSDGWVLKLDGQGNIEWEKNYNTGYDDAIYDVAPTADGGFITAGDAWTEATNSKDFWLMKLGPTGTVEWEKTIGSLFLSDHAFSVVPTADGGFITAGVTWSDWSSGSWSDAAFWVLKLDSNGDIEWEKACGLSGATQKVQSIYPLADGGFIVAGYTSPDHDNEDFWLLKFGADGAVVWEKTYDGDYRDRATSIRPTADGGLIVAGSTAAPDTYLMDLWLLKLDSTGAVEWDRTIDVNEYDMLPTIRQTDDGGFIVGAETDYNEVGTDSDIEEILIARLDGQGNAGDCPSLGNLAATVTDTSADVVDTMATVADSNSTITDTEATVTDTSLERMELCFANPASKDFTSDGKADVLWRHHQTGEVYLWGMDGVNTADGGSVITISDLDWQIQSVGDFDGDLKTDILWRHHTAGVTYIWLMDGWEIKYHQGTNYVISDTDWVIKGVGDFDGDGRDDVLWHHATTGLVCIWLMDGTEIRDYDIFITISDTDWQIERVGDFDGDGKDDIIWRHAAQGTTYVWLMDGMAIKWHQGTQYELSDLDWQIMGIGDFDGDGKDDVLWHHASYGHVCLWLMNGTDVSNYDIFLTDVDLDWQIVDTADYDGDMKADILWLNSSTTEAYVTLMDGFLITIGGNPGSMYDSDWLVYSGGNVNLLDDCTKDDQGSLACPIEGGSSTFLWKPESESTGNLVILIPTDYRCNVESCGIYSDPEGENLIELGTFTTDERNGYRLHYWFDYPGSHYGTDIYCVIVLLDSCDPVSWNIPDGSQRTEY